MARQVKIASFSLNLPDKRIIPAGESVEEFMADFLENNIRGVLSDKPDLIVLPECSDRPMNMTSEELIKYYSIRTGFVLNRIRDIARENKCYIAYSAVRECDDGTRRNSVIMVDRQGEILGNYDKNYPMVFEISDYNILPGDDITVFECDFGRVGAIICFDLNFGELREKYRSADVDVMIFSSMFGGGALRNFFAIETKSYFVSACGKGRPAEIISPLGESVAKSSDYYPYAMSEINLDYEVVHLDFNQDQLRMAKKKYGPDFELNVISHLGRAHIASKLEKITVEDIIREFEIERFDDYFQRSRSARFDSLKQKSV